ncbi:hypothetical protein [Streptomyces sp. NPDC002676]
MPLPGGERDIPLLICDRSFGEDGSFRYPGHSPTCTGTPESRTPAWTACSATSSW